MSDIKKSSPESLDAEFDAFLREENSRLAQLYRKLPHAEPDAALDARVRAQARQALRQHTNSAATQTPSRARRWLPAFSAAAALVLVAGLAWRLVPPTSSTRETTQIAAPASAPPMQEAAPQAPSAPIADTAKVRAKTSADRTAGAVAGAAAPTPTVPADAAKSTAFPSAANAPMVQSAPPAPPRAVPPPPASATASSAPAKAERETMQYAPAPAAARQAAAENRAEAQQAFSDNMKADESQSSIQPDPSDPTRYHWQEEQRSGIYPPDAPPLQTWVAIIRAMLHDGHRDAAQRALTDLRARHPDFRVPPDLHGLE